MIEYLKNMDQIMSDFFKLMNELSGFEKREDKFDFIDKNIDCFEKAAKVIKLLIDSNNFTMHYQPQVDNKGNWVSAEALFRMDYKGKAIYPDVVFALADKFNFEKKLTLKVLDKVCKDTIILKQETSPNFYVTYNINPKLVDNKFCKCLFDTLFKNNLSPSSFGLELLEVSSFDGIKLSDIRVLKNWGFKIIIDDFGSGYADEQALSMIPFDVIKFSGKVISEIDKPENAQNRKRVEDVVEFCKKRKIISIAEHVETEDELKVVRDLGIDKVQGWFFSKAIPLKAFISKCGQSMW